MVPPLGHPKTKKKLSAPLTSRPGVLPLDPAAPRPPSIPPAPNLPLHHWLVASFVNISVAAARPTSQWHLHLVVNRILARALERCSGGGTSTYSVYMAGGCTHWHGPAIVRTAMTGRLAGVSLSEHFPV